MNFDQATQLNREKIIIGLWRNQEPEDGAGRVPIKIRTQALGN